MLEMIFASLATTTTTIAKMLNTSPPPITTTAANSNNNKNSALGNSGANIVTPKRKKQQRRNRGGGFVVGRQGNGTSNMLISSLSCCSHLNHNNNNNKHRNGDDDTDTTTPTSSTITLASGGPSSNFRSQQHKTLSANESFSLPSLSTTPTSAGIAPLPQHRGAARDAFSGSLKEMGDFEVLETLGEGFFGVVYKVREKTNPFAEPIVMKVTLMDKPNLPPLSAKKIASKEDYMLSTALGPHPNILKSKGLCVQHVLHQRPNAPACWCWQLNLLVEFCDGGTLQNAILGPKPMPWLQIGHIAQDICRAMEFVHGRGFLHRDLTSMNVLLKSRPNKMFPVAVVADFGLSTKIPEYPVVLQQAGTQNWMAPEVLKEQFYDEKADLFSFGIILCQMLARIDADHDAGLYRTSDFGIDFVKFAQQKCPKDAPMDLLECAFECCLWKPSSRPSFSELLRRFSAQIMPSLIRSSSFSSSSSPTVPLIFDDFLP